MQIKLTLSISHVFSQKKRHSFCGWKKSNFAESGHFKVGTVIYKGNNLKMYNTVCLHSIL